MDAGAVMALVIGMMVALIMIGIGIFQLRSRTPVTFYTGEKAPAAYEIKDLHTWNAGHGKMWLIYGFVIAAGFILAAVFSHTILSIIPVFCCICAPIPILIIVHHRLVKKYKR